MLVILCNMIHYPKHSDLKVNADYFIVSVSQVQIADLQKLWNNSLSFSQGNIKDCRLNGRFDSKKIRFQTHMVWKDSFSYGLLE